jgi:hypothetical protein
VWFSGVKLRARTTILKLDDGLLVHSPAPPTVESIKELARLGRVRWLVIPNTFHHLGTPEASARYPDATIVGPASVTTKYPGMKLDDIRTFAHPELTLIPLDGVPFLDETLLYHRPTQTLIGTDIALRADAADHWTWRWAARITGCYQKLRVPPDVKKKVDKVAAAATIRAIRGLAIERLIVAHGEVVTENPKEQLLEAWKLVGVE